MKMRSSMTLALLWVLGTPSARAEESPKNAGPAQPQQTQAPTGDSWIDKPAVQQPPRAATPSPRVAPSPTAAATQAQPAKFAAPESTAPKAAPSQAPNGQWVYTQQYGWVWAPYARDYTYVGPEGYPYSYIYYPTYGWCWLYSPWIFGWGPTPYWGVYGRVHFGWYTHPWYGRPIYRGGPAYRGGVHGGGVHGTFGGGFRGGSFRGGGF